MAINKVVYDGSTLIDLTDLDVSADKVAKDTTFIDKTGTKRTGTLENSDLEFADSLYSIISPEQGGWIETDIDEEIYEYFYNEIDTSPEIGCMDEDDELKVTKDTLVGTLIKLDMFGNATSEDVAEGKTFSSAEGFSIIGTKKDSGDGGRLPEGISAIDYGNITIYNDYTTTRQTFNHKLGIVPDFVFVYAPANVAQTYSMLWAMRGSFLGYRSSTYNSFMAYHGSSSPTSVTITNSSSASYGVSNMTATTFQLASLNSSTYWREGTYKYIAIKF